MNRLRFSLLLIVFLPLLLMGWLGIKVSQADRLRIQEEIRQSLLSRLQDTRGQIQRFLQKTERDLLQSLDTNKTSKQALLQQQSKNPLFRQLFYMNAKGILQYPSTKGRRTTKEKLFLERTRMIWQGKAILIQPLQDSEASLNQSQPSINKMNSQNKKSKKSRKVRSWFRVNRLRGRQQKRQQTRQKVYYSPNSLYGSLSITQKRGSSTVQKATKSSGYLKHGWGDSILDLAARQAHGWLLWYWEEGMHLLFWKRCKNGAVVGAELDRFVLMSELIAALPDSSRHSYRARGLIRLLDANNRILYQWGRYQVQTSEKSLSSVALHSPLPTWRLKYYGPELKNGQLLAGREYFNLALMLGSLTLALLVLAFYIHRMYKHELQTSAQRVTFVTQVSHELKTPLTNIRLYAELLENRLPEDDKRAHKHTKVIISESLRLSRLIGNILTFAKQQKQRLKLRISQGNLNTIVERTLEQHRPMLLAKGIETTYASNTKETKAYFDQDAIEQILGNLLSNIEKYAFSGKLASLTLEAEKGFLKLRVEDQGSGIPAHLHSILFQPFVRGSDLLSDGVTGTGIGLTIARDLAQQMGGDLLLSHVEQGAAFELTIPTQSSSNKA